MRLFISTPSPLFSVVFLPTLPPKRGFTSLKHPLKQNFKGKALVGGMGGKEKKRNELNQLKQTLV